MNTAMRAQSFHLAESMLYPAIKIRSKRAEDMEAAAEQYRKAILAADEYLMEVTKPKNHIFGKRLLLSNELYQTFLKSNVDVISGDIDRFTENGIIIKTETEEKETATELDCVVFCTGFRSQEFLCSIKDGVYGKNGKNLQNDVWDKDNCFAYLGITVSDFPNLFMLYGPGTNLGHNSVIFMIECACDYTIKCIELMIKNWLNEVDIKKDIMMKYVEELDKENNKNAWQDPNITNWYKNEKGRGSTNWAFSCYYYWWLTRKVNLNRYNIKSIYA